MYELTPEKITYKKVYEGRFGLMYDVQFLRHDDRLSMDSEIVDVITSPRLNKDEVVVLLNKPYPEHKDFVALAFDSKYKNTYYAYIYDREFCLYIPIVTNRYMHYQRFKKLMNSK